jgi:hypothetical protein
MYAWRSIGSWCTPGYRSSHQSSNRILNLGLMSCSFLDRPSQSAFDSNCPGAAFNFRYTRLSDVTKVLQKLVQKLFIEEQAHLVKLLLFRQLATPIRCLPVARSSTRSLLPWIFLLYDAGPTQPDGRGGARTQSFRYGQCILLKDAPLAYLFHLFSLSCCVTPTCQCCDDVPDAPNLPYLGKELS